MDERVGEIYRRKLLSILQRTGINGVAARRVVDNAIGRSLLITQEPFRTQLQEVRRWVLERVGVTPGDEEDAPMFF